MTLGSAWVAWSLFTAGGVAAATKPLLINPATVQWIDREERALWPDPDGKFALLAIGNAGSETRTRFALVPLDGGEAEELSPPGPLRVPGVLVDDAVWSPGGRFVAVACRGNDVFLLSVLDVQTREWRWVDVDLASGTSPVWVDARQLFFVNGVMEPGAQQLGVFILDAVKGTIRRGVPSWQVDELTRLGSARLLLLVTKVLDAEPPMGGFWVKTVAEIESSATMVARWNKERRAFVKAVE